MCITLLSPGRTNSKKHCGGGDNCDAAGTLYTTVEQFFVVDENVQIFEKSGGNLQIFRKIKILSTVRLVIITPPLRKKSGNLTLGF